jgi:TetR/AcrR family transcriptional regulator, cholesterol catabolism regulator
VRHRCSQQKVGGVEATDGGSDRRQLILEKAGSLFASKGVSSTTVREIGDAVGILSGSLYHHFTSKGEMVEEILAAYVTEMLQRTSEVRSRKADPEKTLAGLIRATFHTMAAHQDACAIFENDHNYISSLPGYEEIIGQVRDVTRIWISTLRDGVTQGTFRDDLEPKIIYHFMRDAICQSVFWFPKIEPYDVDDVADACIALFFGGFLRQRPSPQ